MSKAEPILKHKDHFHGSDLEKIEQFQKKALLVFLQMSTRWAFLPF